MYMCMKKYILLLFVLVAVFSCKKYAWESYQPDTTLHRTGEVSLLATFENLQSKLTMDDGGHGLWSPGDEIAVALSDGQFVNFTLDGTGDTRRAIFKGTIPEGNTLGGVAVYPASAVQDLDGDRMTLSLPQALSDASYPGILIGTIGETWEVSFKQALSFLRLTLNNLPPEATRAKFTANAPLSGLFVAPVQDILSRGLSFADGQSSAPLECTIAEESPYLYVLLPLPSDSYEAIDVTLYDKNNKQLLIQTLSDYAITLSRAELRRMTVELNDVEAPPCRIHIGSDRIEMRATSTGVYAGTYEVPAETSFTIEFDGVPYGFASHSGAGGLGLISDGASALPALRIKQEGKSKKTYYVERAIGSLVQTELGGNYFTINLESPGRVHVVADRSNADAPKYRINVVKETDPSVLFHEDFALCTKGGEYMAPAVGWGGISVNTYDGYLPGNGGTLTANQIPFSFDYPDAAAAGKVAKAAFMEAYGFSDWVLSCVGERPGALQLATSAYAGSVTTPALSSVSGTTNAILTLDLARFSASSTLPITLRVLGAGTFVSGSVTRDAYVSAKEGTSYPEATTAYDTFGDEGTSFVLEDDTYFPHSIDNADVDKPVSHYTFQLSGVTSATKIQIDAPAAESGNNARIFVFDLKVIKK